MKIKKLLMVILSISLFMEPVFLKKRKSRLREIKEEVSEVASDVFSGIVTAIGENPFTYFSVMTNVFLAGFCWRLWKKGQSKNSNSVGLLELFGGIDWKKYKCGEVVVTEDGINFVKVPEQQSNYCLANAILNLQFLVKNNGSLAGFVGKHDDETTLFKHIKELECSYMRDKLKEMDCFQSGLKNEVLKEVRYGKCNSTLLAKVQSLAESEQDKERLQNYGFKEFCTSSNPTSDFLNCISIEDLKGSLFNVKRFDAIENSIGTTNYLSFARPAFKPTRNYVVTQMTTDTATKDIFNELVVKFSTLSNFYKPTDEEVATFKEAFLEKSTEDGQRDFSVGFFTANCLKPVSDKDFSKFLKANKIEVKRPLSSGKLASNEQAISKAIPLNSNGDVAYLINRGGGHFVVSLFNKNGPHVLDSCNSGSEPYCKELCEAYNDYKNKRTQNWH